jgi:hypothetical protein
MSKSLALEPYIITSSMLFWIKQVMREARFRGIRKRFQLLVQMSSKSSLPKTHKLGDMIAATLGISILKCRIESHTEWHLKKSYTTIIILVRMRAD